MKGELHSMLSVDAKNIFDKTPKFRAAKKTEPWNKAMVLYRFVCKCCSTFPGESVSIDLK